MGTMNTLMMEINRNHAECARLARPIGSGFRYACLPLTERHLHAITALRALDVTLTDITHTISEPQVARAKLDWWRGALHQAITQHTAEHPILAALVASVEATTLEKFVPNLEARLGSALLELDYQGFATESDLLAYLDASGGAMYALYSELLSPGPELAAHLRPLGALQRRLHCLQFLGRDSARGFIYLPNERLAAHQLSEADVHRPNAAEVCAPVLQQELAELRENFRQTLSALRQHSRWPPKFFRALIALDRDRITLLEQHSAEVLSQRPECTPFSQLITAWWAAKRPLPPMR
ncbi:MAG TPA: squalene/phytoene synthase family protein [Halothiobacillus sp.]|nr:MAG: hypothetical protein B7Z82_03030 [Halothiobacillus sp. 20-54-6]HQT43467.1 squalene/phytoene synthase family protein [Halothiobacillus sp.]